MNAVIGTRHHLGPDWFHIDADQSPLWSDELQKYFPVDLVCDARSIPLPDERFDHVFSSECLEHFEWRDAPKVVAEWARLVAPGGTMRIETPDLCAAAQQLLSEDSLELHLAMNQIFYAEQLTQWDYHKGGLTHRTLPHYFEQAGLEVTDVKRGYECGWLRVDGYKAAPGYTH